MTTTVRRLLSDIVADVRLDSATPSWENLILAENGGFQLQSSLVDLYGGATGIALGLAFANHYLEIDDPVAEELVDLVAGATLGALVDNPDLPLGLLNGVGGAVYFAACLLHISGRDDRSTYRQIIDVGLARISRELTVDVGTDIVSGAAGLLALATNLRRSRLGDVETLHRIEMKAVAALHEQARHNTVDQSAVWPWPDPSSDWLGGFSHGVGGIAWALSRAPREFAGDLHLRAWRTQMSLFDAEDGTWQDLRSGSNAPEGAFHAWCHGADGIFMASVNGDELAMPMYKSTTSWLTSWARTSSPNSATLCHGRAGRLASLAWIAGQLGERSSDLETAISQARSSVLDDVRHSGSDSTFGLNNGLFLGRAGAIVALVLSEIRSSAPFPLLVTLPRVAP